MNRNDSVLINNLHFTEYYQFISMYVDYAGFALRFVL